MKDTHLIEDEDYGLDVGPIVEFFMRPCGILI